MPNFNLVVLMGNLTRDVEVREAGTSKVADFGIAVNRKYKDKEDTTFIDCEAWGNTAENIAKFFAKGRPIHVIGRLKLDQWKDKEGKNMSKLRVVVENFEFVNSKANGDNEASESSEGETSETPKAKSTKSTKSAKKQTVPSDDDMPF
jgi:single-strand DNA-binding protein